MVYILLEMMKIRHEKMLKATSLYQSHDDAAEKNSSLHGHSNKP